jgi:hypothetical protein
VVELYPEARKVLDAAREARTPSLADRDRIFSSLMASVAVGAVAPSAAAAKTGLFGKIASNALWIKAAASVAVLSAASVSTFAYVRHHGQSSAAGPARVAAPVSALPVAPVAAPLPEPTHVVAPTPAPAPTVSPPTVEHSAPAPSRHPTDGLSAELALLRQAHEARRAGQPERALELAREHAKKYPHSQMWAERETLRVLALCDLGRVDAARRSAASLQYLWSSPLRATLNASCVGK